jgi:hypothetical protein
VVDTTPLDDLVEIRQIAQLLHDRPTVIVVTAEDEGAPERFS